AGGDTRGCVVCNPGGPQCDASGAQICRDDGSGWDPFDCDPLQGLTCNLQTHNCDGACLPPSLEHSNLGCEFFPTVTGNEVRSEFEFAVIISNDGGEPAQV